MRTLSLITHSPYIRDRIIDRLKGFAMCLLGKKIYGPNSVVKSIQRGLIDTHILRDRNIIIHRNPARDTGGIGWVVTGGKRTLSYAIHQKKKGKIKTLIAGPNISVPTKGSDIFFDKHIDYIIIPSQWVKEYFISLKDDIKDKIIVWPAGVEDTGISRKKTREILIYKKNCPGDLYHNICKTLDNLNIGYSTITYGSFESIEYQSKLDQVSGMIYLQTSESQGIALQEARIKDIPTLVWNQGYWSYKNKIRRYGDNISSPYLTKECGMFFDGNPENIESDIKTFITNLDTYTPSKYCKSKLTDDITTENILSYISDIICR